MTDTVQRAVQAILVALCLILAGATYLSHKRSSSLSTELATVRAEVALQNEKAELLLADLTAERDAKQATLQALHEAQERKDADAQLEIARLNRELEQRPIRVRYVTTNPSGPRSGGSTDPPDANPQGSPGDGAETHGVLPEQNARRLREVIAEAEQINAAYASCRAHLFALDSTLR